MAGVISSSESWTEASSPYYINGNTIIQSGAFVSVQPGVRVISTGNFKLVVDGGLRAMGTKDSMISFESITIEFGNNALKYDHSTGSGSRFDYVRFSAFASSGTNVFIDDVDLRFDHCAFTFGYYCIRNTGSSGMNLWVTNSHFKFTFGGFPVYGLNVNSYQYVVGNYFEKISYLYLGEKNVIKNNYIEGISYTYALYWQYYTRELDAQCNNIRNCQYGLNISSTAAGFTHAIIKNNNFDSCRYAFVFGCYNVKFDSIEISNNNILNADYSVNFSGCSGSGSFAMLNFQNNFWGSSDTADFLKTIYDFRKDALVPWKVDIANFHTSPVGACWPLNGSSAVSRYEISPGSNAFAIAPNPARNYVQITLSSSNQVIVICDLKGSELARYKVTAKEVRLDLSHFATGIYLVRCVNMQGISASQRIVLE